MRSSVAPRGDRHLGLDMTGGKLNLLRFSVARRATDTWVPRLFPI